MRFQLNFDVPEEVLQLNHSNEILLLGSCFSNEMSKKFKEYGFSVRSNPFGTLFHPMAIADVLETSLDEGSSVDLFERDGLFFSWDSASKIYSNSLAGVREKIHQVRKDTGDAIKNASLLIITFGTSWGYRHNELNKIVGNCHKAPSSFFTKELTDVQSMNRRWRILLDRIQVINPDLDVVFTVSPVRHVKDGLIENNRSKARLIELTHSLTSNKGPHYFPAYELLIDELRDYRFYSNDLVHPSNETVVYIWERFKSYALTKDAQRLGEKVFSIRRALAHKSIHPGSPLDLKQSSNAIKSKEDLMNTNPEVVW